MISIYAEHLPPYGLIFVAFSDVTGWATTKSFRGIDVRRTPPYGLIFVALSDVPGLATAKSFRDQIWFS